MPKKLESKIYNKAVENKLFCRCFIFSKAQDEKVVKPPKKPINTRNLSLSFTSPFIEKKPNKKPIISEPIVLTNKVPKGKFVVYLVETYSESI